MEIIFQICDSWDKRNCPNIDLGKLYEKKMIEGKKFKLPEKDELEEFNEICKNCKHALKTEERKCPVCENENLQGSPLILFHEKQPHPIPLTSIESGGITQYFYRCENCKRLLYSHKKL